MNRSAELSDIPQILQCFGELIDELDAQNFYSDDWQERMRRYCEMAMPEDLIYWSVIENGGCIVATACAILNEDPAGLLRAPSATVCNVYVKPAFRNRGYGRTVVQSVLDWCRRRGCSSARLIPTEMAIGLYESLGFSSAHVMRLDFAPRACGKS